MTQIPTSKATSSADLTRLGEHTVAKAKLLSWLNGPDSDAVDHDPSLPELVEFAIRDHGSLKASLASTASLNRRLTDVVRKLQECCLGIGLQPRVTDDPVADLENTGTMLLLAHEREHMKAAESWATAGELANQVDHLFYQLEEVVRKQLDIVSSRKQSNTLPWKLRHDSDLANG